MFRVSGHEGDRWRGRKLTSDNSNIQKVIKRKKLNDTLVQEWNQIPPEMLLPITEDFKKRIVASYLQSPRGWPLRR